MVQDPSESEFERGHRIGRAEGYARAVEEWQRRDNPFRGLPEISPITRGAAYEFRTSYFDSYCDYERRVTQVVRKMQRERWYVHSELRQARERGENARRRELMDRSEVLLSFQRDALEELGLVRRAVDSELSRGAGRRCVVDAMRCEPTRPHGVRIYPNVEAFVEDDPRRALRDWPQRRDAGGMDFGFTWLLEEPLRRWETSRWRISWLCQDPATYEVYGIERLSNVSEHSPTTGQVWLLGRIPSRELLDSALEELEVHAQRERNSFAAAARAVARVSRQAAHSPIAHV